MNYEKEFKKFATGHLGLNTLTTEAVMAHQVQNSITPMVVEEREMRATVISVFDRLMMDRILFLCGGVDDRMSSVFSAQLLFLDQMQKKDINLYLDTPGGSVKSGLTMVDLMNYVSSDIVTVNIGMCASMGSVLLSSGTKGKRHGLVFSKVMTHQVSHGSQGNIQETRINQLEAEKYNYILFKQLAKNCGKSFDEMLESSRNDKWFNSSEALNFGLIDEVIGIDKAEPMEKRLEGFEKYYTKEVLKKF